MTGGDELWRQVLAIVAVFALLGLAVQRLRQPGSVSAKIQNVTSSGWLARVISLRDSPERVRIRRLKKVESLALTAHHMVHVVSLDGKDLLVATGPQGCSLLPVEGAIPGNPISAASEIPSTENSKPNSAAVPVESNYLRQRACG